LSSEDGFGCRLLETTGSVDDVHHAKHQQHHHKDERGESRFIRFNHKNNNNKSCEAAAMTLYRRGSLCRLIFFLQRHYKKKYNFFFSMK
jgi:hypothetical protein